MPWIEIILLVIITTPIGLVIHELGHFVAARVLMLEVVSFQAGPFLIDWKNGESTFRFRPLLWLSAGGVRAKVSVETPAKKRVLLTAAGPAASLLFSGIYWLAPVTDIDVIDETDFLHWFLFDCRKFLRCISFDCVSTASATVELSRGANGWLQNSDADKVYEH